MPKRGNRVDAIQSLLSRVDDLRSALIDTMPYVNGYQPTTDAGRKQRDAAIVKGQRVLRNEAIIRDHEPPAADEPSDFTRALAEFHGHPNSILDDKTNGIPLRRVLLAEEFEELLEAIDEDDVAHIAREMADCLYVIFGTALVYRIDLDAAFREIHRAAMVKMEAGLRRADGKIAKPPGFVPPDMTEAIRDA